MQNKFSFEEWDVMEIMTKEIIRSLIYILITGIIIYVITTICLIRIIMSFTEG